MTFRPMLFVAILSLGALAACEKKPDATAAADAAVTPVAPPPGDPGAAAAPGAAAVPGKAAVGTPTAAAVVAGGTVVAANGNGKVLVNDAGAVTAKRANGDTVTTNPNGVTTANGVVVDNKKGTVVVPGVGTFAAPPH